MGDLVNRVEEFFGIKFQNRNPFDEDALRSPRNRRLELLGDAVLRLVVIELLISRLPEEKLQQLTSLIDKFVSNNEIRKISGPFSADMFETILGALYSEQGLPTSRDLVKRTIFDRTTEITSQKRKSVLSSEESKDPPSAKVVLSLKAKKYLDVKPTYQEWYNPAGKKVRVGVYFGGLVIAEGCGATMAEAEENAAKVALIEKRWDTKG